VTSSEARGTRGCCFKVERRSCTVDKRRWLSGCRREDDDRPALYKCGGREDLFTAAALGGAWLALAVRACKTNTASSLTSLKNKQDSFEVCGVWCEKELGVVMVF
jgi:hypothetical protein